MNAIPIVVSLILFAPTASPADAPDAQAIQQALNRGVDLDSPDCQGVSNLQIVAGGKTANGDFLFVCEGDIVWTVSLDEYIAMLQEALKRQGKTFESIAAYAPQQIRQQLPQLKKGDVIMKARIRVRLERAGDDWIPTSTKINKLDPEFTFNPGTPGKATYFYNSK